jgi:hypothetical protein
MVSYRSLNSACLPIFWEVVLCVSSAGLTHCARNSGNDFQPPVCIRVLRCTVYSSPQLCFPKLAKNMTSCAHSHTSTNCIRSLL